jgi:PAS domain S-box-containing protein
MIERWVRPMIANTGSGPQEDGHQAETHLLRNQLAVVRRQIRMEENLYRMILNSAVDCAIIALDLDGVVTQWNGGACRILGWSEAEMLGAPAGMFFTHSDREQSALEAEMSAAVQSGRHNDERRYLRKDGSRFWAAGEMMPMHDENGTIQGFIKTLRDRTEQRRAVKVSGANAELLRGVLTSVADWINVLGLDGKLLFMTEVGQARPVASRAVLLRSATAVY